MTAAIARPIHVSRAERRRWRQFRVYWFGHLLSFTGDWFTILALPLAARMIDDRGVYVGIVAAAALVATPVCGLPLGSLGDRWEPRRVMACTDAVRALMLSATAAWISWGTPPLWVLPAVAFAMCAMRDLHDAAENVMVASVVPASLLVRANGRFQISDGVGHVVGAVLAGAVAAVSPAGALGLDAVSFLVAAGAVNLMGSFPVNRGEQPTTAPWRATWHALRVEDRYWRVIATMAVANLTTACFLAPFVLFAQRELGLDAAGIGVTWAAMGLGGAFAGLALDRVHVLRPWCALVATGTLAIATGITGVARSWPVTIVAFMVVGAVLALGMATVGSLRHASFPPAMQGRVTMASRIVFVLGMAPAVVLASWLADLDAVGPARTYLLFALAAAVATGFGVALGVDRLPVPTPDHVARLLPTDPADAAFWGEPTVAAPAGGAPSVAAPPVIESTTPAEPVEVVTIDLTAGRTTEVAWAEQDPFELIAYALQEQQPREPE